MEVKKEVDQAEMSEEEIVVNTAVEEVNAKETGEIKEEVKVDTVATEEEVKDTSKDKEVKVEETPTGEGEKGEGVTIDEIIEEKPLTEEQKKIAEARKHKEDTPKWMQSRLDEIKRKNAEKLEVKDKRIAELESQSIPKDRPLSPNREDFLTNEEHQKAMTDWKDADDDWKDANKNQEKEENAYQEELNNDLSQYAINSERMAEKYPDFDEVVNKATKYGRVLDRIIIASDFAPEIAYFLGTNPSKLEALKALSPERARLKIGELHGIFKSKSEPKESNAPKPIKPVKESESSVSDDFSTTEIDKMSRELLDVA